MRSMGSLREGRTIPSRAEACTVDDFTVPSAATLGGIRDRMAWQSRSQSVVVSISRTHGRVRICRPCGEIALGSRSALGRVMIGNAAMRTAKISVHEICHGAP